MRVQRQIESFSYRFAAVTQDLIDNLDEEFHDWYTDTGRKHDPFGHIPNPQGPIGDWRNVERFLRHNYPAAHRGLDMGLEEAAPLLDGRPQPDYLSGYRGKNLAPEGFDTPYESGPEAMNQYGYDPSEIAASMLLLHNQSHPFRGEMAKEDQDRLTSIFQKRQKMQMDYEQRMKQKDLVSA